MFQFALRKMRQNRWLALSLLAGYLMAVAIVCSMPVYSHAILSRMLLKDLEQVQTSQNVYPGRLLADTDLYEGSKDPVVKTQAYHQYETQFQELIAETGLPMQEFSVYTEAGDLRVVRAGTAMEDIHDLYKSGGLGACTGLFDQVELLDGAFPSAEAKDGVIEAVVSEEAARNLDCSLGTSYDLYQYQFSSQGGTSHTLAATVKITGVYRMKDPESLFWVMPWSTFSDVIMIQPELFSQMFVEADAPLFDHAQWAAALDYRSMTPENCGAISKVLAKYEDQKFFSPSLRSSFGSILEEYDVRREELTATLWIIEIPILLMLLFYVLMVSRLILGHEKNEIAVLRSRGASKGQITGVYTAQSAVLSLAAFIIGPMLSLLFCQIIGSSNGFMEFVNRKALPVSLTLPAVLYGAATAVLLVITMLAAAAFTGETSIVSFKRKKSGKTPAPLWQRLFLDFICLAVSLYGLYNFQNRLQIIRETGAAASEIPIDFTMYLSSTIFILGGTLLFLRVFPLFIKLVYRIGRRFWGPVLYLSLINTSRSSRNTQAISLFLIFTVSMGIFNAVTVRTLNQNDEDRIRYSIGADIVLQEEWPSTGGSSGSGGVMAPGAVPASEEGPVYYTEPQFSKYENMETAQSAARVLTKKDVSLSANSQKAGNLTLMGIVPNEFGNTCWMKNSLLPHHINEYLNLMADEPRALLLSNSLMEELSLTPGDAVFLTIGDNKESVEFIVYAGIDYFPSFNPVGTAKNTPALAVANLIYLQQETKLEPYAIWLKKAPGVTSAQLYEELTEMGVPITSLQDTTAEVTAMKNDPMTQGINGFFTLSFVVTMLITMVGFFIYWILAIKGRLLQFGILRSMGLTRLSVVMVLLWEQILVSAASILAGLGLGTLTAVLFAPILECNVDAADQILPFTVVAFPEDYWRTVGIVLIMLAAAAFILGRTVFKLHAGGALELGEG